MFKQLIGKTEHKIIEALDLKQNVLISGLENSGVSTLVRGILEEVGDTQTAVTLFLFNYELDNLAEKDFEKFITQKIKGLHGVDIKFLEELFSNTNYQLIIALDKIESFSNFSKLNNFLRQVREKSLYKTKLIYTCGIDYFLKTELETFNKYIFIGFVEKYVDLLDSFSQFYNLPKIEKEKINLLAEYSGYNAGLTKSLMLNIKSNINIEDPSLILKSSEDLQQRCQGILQNIENAGLDIENILKYGLTYNKKIAKIMQIYIDSKTTDTDTELTKTEGEIFNYINTGGFKTIDSIIDFINEGNETYEVTNWTVYKHINNINKKISTSELKIVNVRNKGYILKSTSK